MLTYFIAITSLLLVIGLVWDAAKTGEGINFWGALLLAALLLAGFAITQPSKLPGSAQTDRETLVRSCTALLQELPPR